MKSTARKHRISVKIVLMFVMLLILVVVGIGFTTYNISYQRILDEYNVVASDAGKFAAASVDGERFESWLTNGVDDEYNREETILSNLKKCYELAYLYVSAPVFDEKGEMINDTIYIFDIASEGDDLSLIGTIGEHSGEVDVYEQCKELYRTNTVITSDVITHSEYGWLLSAYVPINNDKGEVFGWVGVDIDMTLLVDSVMSQTVALVGISIVMIIAFAVVFLVYISHSVVKPVKMLSTHMNRFTPDNSKLTYKPITSIKTHDEIEQMAADFNRMASAIVDYTENLERTTAEKERLSADMGVASQIRTSLFDFTYPAFPERTEFDICASLQNAMNGKSNFCDYFFTDENHLFMTVGEASGTGLSSMLFSILAAANIRSFARLGYEPYRIAIETNNELSGRNVNELTVSTIIAQVNIRTGEMKYVNAGLPPILVKKTGQSFSFEKTSSQFIMGEMQNVPFSQETLNLAQGNSVMLMTNGVTQMLDSDGMEFTSSYVESGMNEISGYVYELNEMVSSFEGMLEQFRNGAPLEQDSSVLLFRYFG